MDRKKELVYERCELGVALRKESVDRKYIIKLTDNRPAAVALRKESVDRKRRCFNVSRNRFVSLSARRAWIENP